MFPNGIRPPHLALRFSLSAPLVLLRSSVVAQPPQDSVSPRAHAGSSRKPARHSRAGACAEYAAHAGPQRPPHPTTPYAGPAQGADRRAIRTAPRLRPRSFRCCTPTAVGRASIASEPAYDLDYDNLHAQGESTRSAAFTSPVDSPIYPMVLAALLAGLHRHHLPQHAAVHHAAACCTRLKRPQPDVMAEGNEEAHGSILARLLRHCSPPRNRA